MPPTTTGWPTIAREPIESSTPLPRTSSRRASTHLRRPTLPNARDGSNPRASRCSGRAATSNAVTSRRHCTSRNARSTLDPASSDRTVNLASLAFNVGDFDLASDMLRARREHDRCRAAEIAEVFVALIDSSVDGNLETVVAARDRLEQHNSAPAHRTSQGVGYLNLANCLRALGDFAASLAGIDLAIDLLDSSAARSELAAATCHRAWALAHLYGDRVGSRRDRVAGERPHQATELRETLSRAWRHRSLVTGVRGERGLSGPSSQACGEAGALGRGPD